MLSGLLRRVFGGGSDASGVLATEEYQGFELRAAPMKESNGWRVAGSVVKAGGDDTRVHEFIRADTYPNRDIACQVSLNKARQLVDERGEGVFDQ